jgi:hypothetical protein
MKNITGIMLGATFLAAAFSSTASARGRYFQAFQEQYAERGIDVTPLVEDRSCAVCHNRARGGGERNAYGQDYEAIALGEDKGFIGIEALDSDKDDFNNLEEIFLSTAPGDEQSAPAGRIVLTLQNGEIEIKPTKTCKQLDLLAFGYSFAGKSNLTLVDVTGSQKVAVEDIVSAGGTVLARCVAEAQVGSVSK